MNSIMEFLSGLVVITIINLALSGDNAAVISLAIKDLPTDLRKKASLVGAGGAIVLRVIFTILATILMTVPYLNAIGGVVLLWITWSLISHKEEDENVKSSNKFWSAVSAIIIADISMSFDNVMGVAGAAQGNVALLIFGLLLSIPIIILGSNWLAVWMDRKPFLIYIGGAVLAHTALGMLFHDKGLDLPGLMGGIWETIIPWGVAILVLVWGWFEAKKILAARTDKKDKNENAGYENARA